jgi:hypothetical protein
MTKTTNILRCTLTQTFRSDFTSDLANVELYMLCSDQIAAAARKLTQKKEAYRLDDRDNPKLEEYLRDYVRLEAMIVKAFKQEIECNIGDLHINPDDLPSETRSRLEWIRDALIDELPADSLLICLAKLSLSHRLSPETENSAWLL